MCLGFPVSIKTQQVGYLCNSKDNRIFGIFEPEHDNMKLLPFCGLKTQLGYMPLI